MNYAIDEKLVAKARELGPLIREHAPEAERERRLSKPVLDALNRSGITKMLLPKSLGGLETDPVTMLRVVEEIASHRQRRRLAAHGVELGGVHRLSLPRRDRGGALPRPERLADRNGVSAAGRSARGRGRLQADRPARARERRARRALDLPDRPRHGRRAAAHGARNAGARRRDHARERRRDPRHLARPRPARHDSTDVAVHDLFVPKAFTCPLVPPFEPNKHYRLTALPDADARADRARHDPADRDRHRAQRDRRGASALGQAHADGFGGGPARSRRGASAARSSRGDAPLRPRVHVRDHGGHLGTDASR